MPALLEAGPGSEKAFAAEGGHSGSSILPYMATGSRVQLLIVLGLCSKGLENAYTASACGSLPAPAIEQMLASMQALSDVPLHSKRIRQQSSVPQGNNV